MQPARQILLLRNEVSWTGLKEPLGTAVSAMKGMTPNPAPQLGARGHLGQSFQGRKRRALVSQPRLGTPGAGLRPLLSMVATITMTMTALDTVLKPPPALFRLMFTPTNCRELRILPTCREETEAQRGESLPNITPLGNGRAEI